MTDAPLIVLRGLEGNMPPTLTVAQSAIVAHLDAAKMFWWMLFALTLVVVVSVAYNKTKRR